MKANKIRWYIITAVILVVSSLFLRYFLRGAPNLNSTSYIIEYLLINLLAIFLLIHEDFRGHQWIGFAIGLSLQLWYLFFQFIPPAKLYAACGCSSGSGCDPGCISVQWKTMVLFAWTTLALNYGLGQRLAIRTSYIILMIGAATGMVFLFPPYQNNSSGEVIYKFLAYHPIQYNYNGPIWSFMAGELSLILIWLVTIFIAFLSKTERRKIIAPPILWIIPLVVFGMLVGSFYSDYYISWFPFLSLLVGLIIVPSLSVVLIIHSKDANTRQRIAFLTGLGYELSILPLFIYALRVAKDSGSGLIYGSEIYLALSWALLEQITYDTFIVVVILGLKKEIVEKYWKIFDGISRVRRS